MIKNVNILRTDGTAEEVMRNNTGDMFQIFLTSINNKVVSEECNAGDLLTNENDGSKFAIISRTNATSKFIDTAVELGIYKLVLHVHGIVTEEEKPNYTFVISKNEFLSTKEEHTFIAIIEKIFMMEIDASSVSIVICNY